MLKLVNINCHYGLVHVLKNLSLHVKEGEIVTLIGANGAGKTTTLRSISGLHSVSGGSIFFMGKEVKGVCTEKRVAAGIAMVPEGRQIFRPMTVVENLMIGGNLIHRRNGRKSLQKAMDEMYEIFPLLKERKSQYSGTLSGGEQQMLALAMALIRKPRLLLLDEPSMGLAPLIVKDIFNTILMLNQETGLTVLLVEQNANAALNIAHRGYVLETGRIILEDSASALRMNPEVTRAYLGKEKREIWE